MKKTRIRMLSWMLGILFSMALAVNAAAAEKNALDSYKAVTDGKTATIGKTTYGYSNSGIYTKKGSTKKTIIKKALGTYVTDGKYLYYATGTYKGIGEVGVPVYSNRKIYKYSISGKKSTLIYKKSGTGEAFVPFASDGRYLYLGNEAQYGGCYNEFCVYDMKTKKMVSLKKTGFRVCRVQAVKDKVLVSAEFFPHGGPFFLMNKNGTKVISLTKEYVDEYRIEGKYIYFKEQTYDWKWRNCRCKLDGSSKKALTSWKY